MKYSIDGFFLTQRATGTQRYSLEILSELDKLCVNNDIEIVVPMWWICNSPYQNIKMVRFGNFSGIFWEQIDFALYLLKTKRQGIYLNNVVSIIHPKGIVAIHDVCYKVHPEFYTSIRDKLSMFWHRFNYWIVALSNMKIITVSNFSKSELINNYGVNKDRITVIYPSWQHVNKINNQSSIFDLNDKIVVNNYYFSLSSLGANKNYKWILHTAKENPHKLFVIAGGGKLKGVSKNDGFGNLSNVLFLGYVNDEDIKVLMKNCKAFLFPTLYEGFGLTPLEAIACGAPEVIVSDTPCMHEVYGNFVSYIDPFSPYKGIIRERYGEPEELLSKYSWIESAKVLFKLCND